MSVKRQQGSGDQMDLFDQALVASLCHGATGESGTGPGACAEPQAFTAWEQQRALTQMLMEEVASSANLNQAYQRVKANKGAAGVDAMSVAELLPWIRENRERLIASLLDVSYQPKTVRGVEIPKTGGGTRQLGIPTVVDRLVQQAILQVLEPILDPTFSVSSFGFRPGKSAHQALAQAQTYVADGREIVVDIDLEKFFDRVNHDILMGLVAKRVTDKRILKLVRGFLTAGVLIDGLVGPTEEGTPQGGPLSPLLSNLMLDVLDKELEKRGHRFVRYADDCNIYVRSQRAGERVLASVEQFLTKRLKLKVNKAKSAVAAPRVRKFLGFSFTIGANVKRRLAPQTVARFKARVRELTRRTRGRSLAQIIEELSRYLEGWRAYFGFCETPSVLRRLEHWTRRRLRAVSWKQWKRGRTRFAELRRRGVGRDLAAQTAGSPHGPWRLSNSPALALAFPNAALAALGLPLLVPTKPSNLPNRRVRTRTHGGVGGVGS